MKKGVVIWLTGLSGAGKTTIARALQPAITSRSLGVELLDGDVVRKELSPDLGFSKADREAHARRVVYLCKILSRNGVISIVSLISPYREFRAFARDQIGDAFFEVFVKASLEACMKRDPKGLYKKAVAGEIKDMTGLQDPYEEPLNPELVITTETEPVEESVKKILAALSERGYLPGMKEAVE